MDRSYKIVPFIQKVNRIGDLTLFKLNSSKLARSDNELMDSRFSPKESKIS